MRTKLSGTMQAADCRQLAEAIGNDSRKLNQLLEIIESKDDKISDRAAWVLTFWMDAHAQSLASFFERFMQWLTDPDVSEPVKRQTLSMIYLSDIPEIYHGDLLQVCFDTIQSPATGSAPKAFCIHLLGRLCKVYPELVSEIRMIIEDRWPVEKAAFRSAAKHFLKKHKEK